jgi:hypothetical protein
MFIMWLHMRQRVAPQRQFLPNTGSPPRYSITRLDLFLSSVKACTFCAAEGKPRRWHSKHTQRIHAADNGCAGSIHVWWNGYTRRV